LAFVDLSPGFFSLKNCYTSAVIESMSSMTGKNYSGGLIGYSTLKENSFIDCNFFKNSSSSFWNKEINSYLSNNTLCQGSQDTIQMKNSFLYLNAGWNKENWIFEEKSYPKLKKIKL
jgi:hypothetical protein